MSTPPAVTSPPAMQTRSRGVLVSAGIPAAPAVVVGVSGVFLATYLALAVRSLGGGGLAAAAFVLVAAGVFVAWWGLAHRASSRTEPALRADRLARQALPFLALLPPGILAPEFLFGDPGPGRVAVVLATCLLLFLILWFHATGKTSGVTDWLERHTWVVLFVVVAAHALVTTVLVVVRHHYYNAILGEDTAYYNQIFWSTLHGDFFQGSLTQARYTNPPIHSEFGAHNSPVLFLLLPAYWAHPSFYTLLVIRNLALSMSAVPLYLLARAQVGSAAALGVAVVHLLGPNLLSQSINAFFPLQLAILLLPVAFLAFERARFGWFLAAFLLAMSVREEIALTGVLLAGYAVLRRRPWRWVIVPGLLALAWWYVSTHLIIVPSRIAMEDLDEFYRTFPDGYRGAAGTLLRHPISFLQLVATTDNIGYLYQLAKWTAGIGLATPTIVFILPTVLINVVVGAFWKTTTLIGMHYSVVASVCVSLALVYGLANLTRGHRVFRIDARPFALVLILLLTPQVVLGVKDVVAFSGGHQKSFVDDLRPQPYYETFERIVRLVQAHPTAAVAAPNDLLPHLSNRRELYNTNRLWWYGEPRLDYVVVDGDVQRFDRGEKHRARYRHMIATMQADPAYRLLIDENNFRLYQVERSAAAGATKP